MSDMFVNPFAMRIMDQAGGSVGQQAEQAFDPYIKRLQQLYKETPVEVPDAPEAPFNPFANLGTALGMAVTGQGAQYSQQMAQAAQFQAQQVAQHQAMVQQARNYDALRQAEIAKAEAQAHKDQKQAGLDAQVGFASAQEDKRRDDRDYQLRKKQVDASVEASRARAAGRGEEQADIYSLMSEARDRIEKSDYYAPIMYALDEDMDVLRAGAVPQRDADGQLVPQEELVPLASMSPQERNEVLTRLYNKTVRDFDRMIPIGTHPQVKEAIWQSRYAPIFEGLMQTEQGIAEEAGQGGPMSQRLMEEQASKAKPVKTELEGDEFDGVLGIARWLEGGSGSADLRLAFNAETMDDTPTEISNEVARRAAFEMDMEALSQGVSGGGARWLKGKGAGSFKGVVERVAPLIVAQINSPRGAVPENMRAVKEGVLSVLEENGIERDMLNTTLHNAMNDIIRRELGRTQRGFWPRTKDKAPEEPASAGPYSHLVPFMNRGQ